MARALRQLRSARWELLRGNRPEGRNPPEPGSVEQMNDKTRARIPARSGSAILGALFLASPAAARITRITVDCREAFSYQGQASTSYEKAVGHAFGELDPFHPLNVIITDIQLAREMRVAWLNTPRRYSPQACAYVG